MIDAQAALQLTIYVSTVVSELRAAGLLAEAERVDAGHTAGKIDSYGALHAAVGKDAERLTEQTRKALTSLATRQHRIGITVFTCGGKKPTCYRCGSTAVKKCDAPVGEGKVCGRPLCDDHARGTRCSQHAPESASSTMPRPPGRRS